MLDQSHIFIHFSVHRSSHSQQPPGASRCQICWVPLPRGSPGLLKCPRPPPGHHASPMPQKTRWQIPGFSRWRCEFLIPSHLKLRMSVFRTVMTLIILMIIMIIVMISIVIMMMKMMMRKIKIMKIMKIMKRMKIKVKINEIPKWIQSRTVPGYLEGCSLREQILSSAPPVCCCCLHHLDQLRCEAFGAMESLRSFWLGQGLYTYRSHYVTYMIKWMCIFVYVCVSFLFKNFCWPECLRLNLLTICRKCPSNHIGLLITCQRPAQARHNLKSVLWMVTGEAFHRSDSCLCLLTNTDHSRVKGNARLELQARTVTLR